MDTGRIVKGFIFMLPNGKYVQSVKVGGFSSADQYASDAVPDLSQASFFVNSAMLSGPVSEIRHTFPDAFMIPATKTITIELAPPVPGWQSEQ